MKLKFDANQDYQIDAIKSITDLFEGQPLKKGEFELSLTAEDTGMDLNVLGIGNNLLLSEEQLLKNLQEVQKRNNIQVSDQLDDKHFSVEMETGTGKTYVYLRTVYELNARYGFTKFVIVVPSVAIREGVLKNLEVTYEHLQGLYSRVPCAFKVYDSKNVPYLRTFALNASIQILVMNIDAFAKDTNIINNPNDRLTGKRPIEFIKATNPIVIVDEPQNMETPLRKQAIENLNPLCTLRYSATHLNKYNLVYSLNPVKAYDLGLVKQIEVDSVVSENSYNDAYVQLKSLGYQGKAKTKIVAKLEMDVNIKNEVKRKTVNAKCGDDLFKLSGYREAYKNNFIIEEVDITNQFITFTNGLELQVGQSSGSLTDELMKYQIQKTVEEHFAKSKRLKEKGIKVLSLFFIDRVANYISGDAKTRAKNGKFALWFEEAFEEISKKPQYAGVISFESGKVHDGYFSQDRNGYKDTSGETLADYDTYQLIMKKKEELLDINNPLQFIFSHSALREGWDNPNVFQICTLNETSSTMKKRQEIGRGLRLCVDQKGERIRDKNINRLTVVANESYEAFAKELQKQIEEDCGVSFEGKIKNKSDRKQVSLRKGFELDERFLNLWNRIKHKTRYRVRFNTEELINKAAIAVKEMPPIARPKILSRKTQVDFDVYGITGKETAARDLAVEVKFDQIPDLVGYVQSKTELTRDTVKKILDASGRTEEAFNNPQLFLDFTVQKIKNALNEILVEGIEYKRIAHSEYEMKIFEGEEIEHYVQNLRTVSKPEKTITDHIVIDSASSPECQFVQDCENNEQVEFYIKLPKSFKIETPVGKYNPDWALIFKNESRLYFVAETKSTLDLSKLRPDERLKIKCGTKHFEKFEDVEFRHVTQLGDLIV